MVSKAVLVTTEELKKKLSSTLEQKTFAVRKPNCKSLKEFEKLGFKNTESSALLLEGKNAENKLHYDVSEPKQTPFVPRVDQSIQKPFS